MLTAPRGAGTFPRVTRPRSLVVGIAALALLIFAAPAAAGAEGLVAAGAPEPGQAVAEALAKKYVPIAMLREEQHPPCETSAEQYQPTSVDTMLGNPTVTLQHYVEPPGGGKGKLEDIAKAPTVADVAGLRDGYYLNLEGEALGDTCVYSKAFKKLLEEGKAPAITYAHVAREANHPGFVMQYWFFWYFNQFNDLHEGDWEGMQLAFEGSETPAEALRKGEEPGEMIVFQHAGGERANWDDSKVQKEGTHPVVYPAAGSHATFYDSAVYVQNGQGGSGVGCDNTTEPLRELKLRPVLLPETAPPTGEFSWLTYDGRWGEREKGFNNGPTGPQTKHQWREPFAWMEAQRSTSPRLPGGSIVGPQVTGAFCGAVATASELINLDIKSHLAAVLTIVVLLALVLLFAFATRWWPVELEQLRRRRALGQIVRAARQFYGRYWRAVLPIGLTAIPVVGGVNLLAQALSSDHDVGNRAGLNLAFADLIEFLGRPVAAAIVAAAVIVCVRIVDEGGRPSFAAGYRGMGRRFWRVVGAQILATLGVTAMAITVVGLPFSLWKLVGWQFVAQLILFEDLRFRGAFKASSELVRGRWWRTARVTLFFFLLSVAAGPVVGFALIFLNFSLLWINLIGSLIFALLVPYVTLGHTFLYLDLSVRAEEEPVGPKRSWRERLARPWPQRRRAEQRPGAEPGTTRPSPRPGPEPGSASPAA